MTKGKVLGFVLILIIVVVCSVVMFGEVEIINKATYPF